MSLPTKIPEEIGTVTAVHSCITSLFGVGGALAVRPEECHMLCQSSVKEAAAFYFIFFFRKPGPTWI